MKIITLGTGHGYHTSRSFNSSTLFEISGKLYLFDTGEPVTGLMVRKHKSVSDLKAVFITHMHGDHVSGLPVLINTLLWQPIEGQHTDIFLTEKEVPKVLEAWMNIMHTPVDPKFITLKVVTLSQFYQDENIKVTAIQTKHLHLDGSPVSFAYKIEAEGKKILCSGDLRGDFSDFPEIVQQEPFDLCICEATHYQPSSALPVFIKCPLKRLIFNHIYDDWYDEGEKRLLDHYKTLPYPVEIAHDGDEFIL